ncbi:MAG: 3-hydroxyacyl-ACP dehydratase FabZ [Novosphingobium sp.]|nr:3-hydroxyacyl-ACP dehydratase FabZ [Novosphingobium sp.]
MSEGTDGDAAPAARPAYDIRRILEALPHRYPLLLVDRVESLTIGEAIHAVKAVSFNEQFFQGHFPGRPIMPGVLQIEALAQAAAILAIETLELTGSGKLVYFMAIDEAKFRAPVEPGVLLDLNVGFVQKRARVCKFWGKASIAGKLTCEAQFTALSLSLSKAPRRPRLTNLAFRANRR